MPVIVEIVFVDSSTHPALAVHGRLGRSLALLGGPREAGVSRFEVECVRAGAEVPPF